MKKRFMISLFTLGLGLSALASIVILFDPATGRNLRRIDSADTLAYMSRTDALINPVLPTNELRLCYVTNGQVLPIPQEWLDAEALAAWIASSNAQVLAIAIQRSNYVAWAKEYANGTNSEAQYFVRALFTEVLREVNELRSWHGSNAITKGWMLNSVLTNITNDPR